MRLRASTGLRACGGCATRLNFPGALLAVAVVVLAAPAKRHLSLETAKYCGRLRRLRWFGFGSYVELFLLDAYSFARFVCVLYVPQVWRVEWNVTGTVLASACEDGLVHLWRTNFQVTLVWW